MKFLLDTNFLLIPGIFRVDVFSELCKFGKPEMYTLDLVRKELETISKGTSKDSMSARLALQLLGMKGVSILNTSGGKTDEEIEKLAKIDNFIVCTQDKKLIQTLKREKVKVVSLRQKKYLQIYGGGVGTGNKISAGFH